MEDAIRQGANDYNSALIQYIINEDRPINFNNMTVIDFLIEKGANNFNEALQTALELDKMDVLTNLLNQMRTLNIGINPRFNNLLKY